MCFIYTQRNVAYWCKKLSKDLIFKKSQATKGRKKTFQKRLSSQVTTQCFVSQLREKGKRGKPLLGDSMTLLEPCSPVGHEAKSAIGIIFQQEGTTRQKKQLHNPHLHRLMCKYHDKEAAEVNMASV